MTTSRNILLVLSLLLAVATAVCYLPAYQAGFVDFDDSDYVFGNDHVINGVTPADVGWAFTHGHSSNWHPLTWISHMIDVDLFGYENPGARGHHVVNVTFHVVNVILLFLALTSLTRQLIPSFVVAALFAIHPVNVESVAWISQRKTTLSTLFGILSIWSYGAYARGQGRKAYLCSLVMFACSLMSKQMLVTMPFALLLLDYWPLKRAELEPGKGRLPTMTSLVKGWWRLFPEKIPYLALTVVSSIVTLLVQQGAMRSVDSYPVIIRLGNVIVSYAGYLVSLIWPTRLAVFYPLYEDQITPERVIVSLVVLVAITAVCLTLGRRWRYLLVGWLWYLGTMVPVIGLVQVGAQSMADRYAYIPFWGLFIALVWAGYDLLTAAAARAKTQWTPWAATACALLALALTGCGWLTFKQTEKWDNSIALFEDAVADTNRNFLAHRILADQYYEREDVKKTLAHCEEAKKCHRDIGRLLATYGMALYIMRSKEEGLKALQDSVAAEPEKSIGHLNLGWVLADLGRDQEAIAQFALAEKYLSSSDKRYARRMVYANWAKSLLKLHHPLEAAEKYDRAIQIDRDCDFVLSEAARLDLELGKPERAIERLTHVAKLMPDDIRNLVFLALAYKANGDLDSAVAQLKHAHELNPNDFQVIIQLAEILARQKKSDEARALLEQALAAAKRLPGDQAHVLTSTVLRYLGDLDLSTGDAPKGVEHYNQSLADWGDNYQAANNLAWLLATSPDQERRDPQRAVQLAEHASKLLKRQDHSTLGTLAAAYAAKGSMSDAVKTAEEAISLANKAGDKRAAASFERQLELYRRGQPYVDQQ